MGIGTKVIHEPSYDMYDAIVGEIIAIKEEGIATIQYKQNKSLVIQNFKFTDIRKYEI